MGVRAGRAALVALLATSIGVLTIGTGGGAGMLLGGMCIAVDFGLGTFRAGCTFLLTCAATGGLLLRGHSGGTSLSTGMILLAVQVGMRLFATAGGAYMLFQLGGGDSAVLRADCANETCKGDHHQELLHV